MTLKGLKMRKSAKNAFFLYFLYKTPIKTLFYKNIVDYPCSPPFQRSNQDFSEPLHSYADS